MKNYIGKLLISFLTLCGISQSGFSLDMDDHVPLASSPDYYYGKELFNLYRSEFKNDLHKILNSGHISNSENFDILVNTCEDLENCYSHRSHGYKKARRFLFGQLFLYGDSSPNYFTHSVYCQTLISNQTLGEKANLGPMMIPESKVVNTEHAWPQSLFTQNFPKGFQKSDLHALYPVRSKINSLRGNNPFGNVEEVKSAPCEEAALGYDKDRRLVFEPSDSIKGNIARSIFYFSTRYKIALDPSQERTLRHWHVLDPVDQEERQRHEEIFVIQHNRNPFVDHPEWVEKVDNF